MGAIQTLKEKIFGKADHRWTEDPFEAAGIKVTLDWNLVERKDALRKGNEEMAAAPDPDSEVRIMVRVLDEVAFFEGEPVNNPNFFRSYAAWHQLLADYMNGIDCGGLEGDSKNGEARELVVEGRVVGSKSVHSKHLFPNTPIVIHAGNQEGDNRIKPFYRTDMRRDKQQ